MARVRLCFLVGLIPLWAPQAYLKTVAQPFDESTWRREVNMAISAGVFDGDRARAMELVAELAWLQRRSSTVLPQSAQAEYCRFPVDSTHPHNTGVS
eukprot:COSAG02_NODE_33291_length_502_cov_1.019851_1_plen_96_part_10